MMPMMNPMVGMSGMGGGMPGMGGMMPFMMPPQLMHGGAPIDDESDGEGNEMNANSGAPSASAGAVAPPPPAAAPVVHVPVYNKDESAFISRSTSILRNLPRNRLVNSLERLDGELDAGYLSLLSQRGLLMLLWMYTHLRPGARISTLGCLAAINTSQLPVIV